MGIYSRAKSATQFNVPGPGAYRNEDVRSAWKAAPKYSLSARAKSGNSNASPGPAAYLLPKSSVAKPGTPAYTMRTKPNTGSFMEDLAKVCNFIFCIKSYAPGNGQFERSHRLNFSDQ